MIDYSISFNASHNYIKSIAPETRDLRHMIEIKYLLDLKCESGQSNSLY